ncbi:Cytidine and deoxycytidylate deaminase zinc-binding region [Loktanella fryxellensis]|uniref:Cytidine and deoxycytidylate deaminase zinc-binding region n=1 Tax=Loktanella fryxellensis TaxID=245187 RepID=A0A1H8IHL6_9RHOB|nr:nucleoside deaminase [Loktanella fryxellensis]SEN68370.1 Cytidine and deoxycytidylate deaminase zinc-binding region [Loktanella fryxellensis]
MKLTATETQAMDGVADHACKLHDAGQDIVFAAAVVQGDRIVVQARNEVDDTGDVSRHAEVVAIARASEILGTRDLSGCTLIASCQPCEMCLAAMRWAQIDRLVFAAQQDNTDTAFFRFPQLRIEDYHRACDHAFDWQGGVAEDRVTHIYAPKEPS